MLAVVALIAVAANARSRSPSGMTERKARTTAKARSRSFAALRMTIFAQDDNSKECDEFFKTAKCSSAEHT
jgi:hypothetical protein